MIDCESGPRLGVKATTLKAKDLAFKAKAKDLASKAKDGVKAMSICSLFSQNFKTDVYCRAGND